MLGRAGERFRSRRAATPDTGRAATRATGYEREGSSFDPIVSRRSWSGACHPAQRKGRLLKGINALQSFPRRPADLAHYSLARRLTERDRAIVAALGRHRVFTTEQLGEMFFGSSHRARVRLVALQRLGVLDRFQPHRPGWGASPYHYVLGRLGAAIAAAEAGEDPDRATRRWRGERTLALGQSRRLAQLVGVNGFYAALVAESRRGEGMELVDWLTEAECARWADDMVRPDAFGEWREHGEVVEFFLEWGRGTETLARLADKLTGYERFETERGESAWVLFAFPSPRRETAARAALAGATAPAATGTMDGALRPHEALWLPLGHPRGRVGLAALAHVPKPPEAVERAGHSLRSWRYERSRRHQWAGEGSVAW